MGNSVEKAYAENPKPSNRLEPYNFEKPSFDPNYGFPNGRPQRVMIATEEQLRRAKIPKENRDYCAHHLLQYHECRKENVPLLYKCHHDRHVYLQCQYEDYVLRMKEFERERRLRAREHRILQSQ